MKTEFGTQVRTRGALLQSIQSGWIPKWVFFWGHTPERDGSISKACLSQWWDGNPFEVDGVRYLTAEHFMMAEKAKLFSDAQVVEEILQASNPAVAKKLGRTVHGFDDRIWRDVRFDIVVRGNIAKFGQHAELKAFLLKTGQRVIVEASPRDRIWGIGLSASSPDAQNPENWRGENLLGFALMEARQQLRDQEGGAP